ncbi:Predicted arabinose efflux permease, MFS family [Halopseudomonas xinjiangensis]|uniref:Predicted arabinose efflux permease, MFS family n=1 Tax=Halopseudomonas xinjiangensis TaxID=487184 RepID=A0A1H1TXZ1_9GAMM|nr:YbfB/YjiJ family MFS transporter [Halopseudomonas xinjiangensis]SDS65082.1 Predicted arabinose efflux permease, MFS family [Halopseudomonas xinjiangensis]
MPGPAQSAVEGHGPTRVILAGICALILTVGLARFAYTPLLPVMRDGAGLSDLAGGWLATFNYLGYITGALIAATTSSLQRKFVMYRIGLVLGVLTTAAMGLTDNVYWWTLWRYLAGLSSTAGLLLASGLALNWLIRHQYKPELGVHFAGLGIGIAVSGVAVGLMIGRLDWAEQWLGLGLLGLVFAVPAWLWLPAPAPVTTDQQQGIPMDPVPDRRWMRLFIAAYFCAGAGYVVSATFIVAIVERLPIFSGWGSWMWVLVGLAAAPSTFLWDRIATLTGGLRALMLAYALQIVSIVLPAVSEGSAANLLAAVLYGNTFVGIVSLTLSIIGRRFPANPAKAMARLTISYGIAQIVVPAIAGYIASATGSYHGALWLAAAMMVLGIGALMAAQRRENALQRH